MSSGRRRAESEKDHVYCFIPREGIDVFVLAAYLKRWIDGTATIEPSTHPRDPSRLGFNVGASSTLSREAIEDLIEDTSKWHDEQNTREFQKDPYDYIESDTFALRKRKGPTPGDNSKTRLTKPRTRLTQPGSSSLRSAREAKEEPVRSRQSADVGSDRPPEYSQVPSANRARARDASTSPERTAAAATTTHPRPQPGKPGPRPSNPHPLTYQMEKLAIDKDPPKPNQKAAGAKSGRTDATSKSWGRSNAEDQGKRDRHGSAQY